MSHNIPIKYLCFLLDNKQALLEPDVEIPLDDYYNSGRSVKFYEADKE